MRNPKRISKLPGRRKNINNRGGVTISKETVIMVLSVLLAGCILSGCIAEKSPQNHSDAYATGGNMTKDLIQIDNNMTVEATWVQDTNTSELIGIMENEVRTGPEGSGYLIGPSKNKSKDVGIYFYDPTATN